MPKLTQTPGITFAVDDVEPTTKSLPEIKIHQAIKEMVGSDIESCGDYHGSVLEGVDYQPLLAAVHLAYSLHRPLILTPDAVWLTIAQGVANHMTIHAERLRSRFVSHSEQLKLVFETPDWVERSPENPWPEAFAGWASKIREHVGADLHDRLVCDFNTTGPIERAVSQIVLMDIFERYFHYEAVFVCGIPTITLEGSPADWERLREKAAGLQVFDIGWWLEHLLPICDQFVCASRDDVNPNHWQRICKLREAYGGSIINGWICKLFPYLRQFRNGPCCRRNPVFETGAGMRASDAPPGLSRVPFKWRNLVTGRSRAMEIIGGLVGVTQDPATLALRPKIGWAVRAAEKLDVLLARLKSKHKTFGGAELQCANSNTFDREMLLPPDLCKFYDRTNGAELFRRESSIIKRVLGKSQQPAFRIRSLADTAFPTPGDPLRGDLADPRIGGGDWRRIVTLFDGTCFAINLSANPQFLLSNPKLRPFGPLYHDSRNFAPVCHCHDVKRGNGRKYPIVALSFTELLERMLASDGKRFWRDAKQPDYGDAGEVSA